MIACRADRRILLLAAALSLGGAEAIAQIGPPVRLLPRPDNLEEPPVERPRDVDPVRPVPRADPFFEPGFQRPRDSADPRRIDQTTIEITTPKPIDADGAGAIDTTRGALPDTLWAGSSRPLVERLMGEITVPIVSPTVRSLAIRVLGSGGEPPTARADGAPDQRSFVVKRAEKLLALGDAADAAELARAVPKSGEDAALGRILLDAAWIANDTDAACEQAFAQIAHFDDPYRQKALIFCQASKNDKDRAQLGLRMLREQQTENDPLFERLIAIVLGDARGPLDSVKAATPLQLAMARAAKLQLPADAAQGAAPAVLGMIAATTNASSDARLTAAERAEAAGAIATATLAQLYDAVTARPEDLTRALDIAARERGPRSRWLPYRAAKAQPANAARLAILARYWQMARERTAYAAAARVGVPLLQEITPAPEAVAYAGDAARVLLLANQGDSARQWIDVAASAGTLDATAADTAALAWPLLRLAGAAADIGDAETATRLEAWRKAQQRLNPQGLASRTAMLAMLLSALGDGGATDLLAIAAASPSPERAHATTPGLGVMIGLGDAVGGKRVGETALLAIVALGGDGPASVAPLALVKVLEALRTVGLAADARALALEAAIIAGL